MSWSLQVSNGDLSFGGTGMNTVTAADKLVQDLSCCILEPVGTDPLHPSYGSIIDGGVDYNGNQIGGIIGGANDQVASTFVSAEIQRICQNYQQGQVARNNADLTQYGASTLSVGEALLAVENVHISTLETAMSVNVTLQTGGGTTSLSALVG